MMAASKLEKSPTASNVVQMFLDRARTSASQPAARSKVNGTWQDVSWGDFAKRAERVSNALMALGVKKGDRINLMGDTRFEWVVCDLGIQGAGAVTVPIYQSNLPDECQYVAENCGAEYVLVDSAAQAAKFIKIKDQLPGVKNVIQIVGNVADAAGGWVRTLDSLYAEGDKFAQANPTAFEERSSAVTREDLSTIIYTSGTTGKPKGVMLTHDAFCFEAESVDEVGIVTADDVELFFLPLAHSFAQVLKAIWFRLGHVMAFAESLEKLIDNMGEVKPTMMASVPRVFEKAFNKVVTDGSATPGLKGTLFRMTMAEFEKYAQMRDEGREYESLKFAIGRKLVLSKVREKLNARFGGNLRFFISGGAPLARKIAYFFDLTGVTILEGFGLTETCAATCVNRLQKNKIGTVGPAIPGMEVKLASDGELLIRGRGVMKGYYNNPEATKEVLLDDGWFATGDIAEIDSDGYVRITDRKKDIIVTAGGKNVAPQNLENALKSNSIVSQVVVHGDKRKYLTAVFTVSEDRAKQVAAEQNISYTDYADLTRKPEIRALFQAAVDELNKTLPSYESIKKFEILPNDFSQETGEMTPTLKVKRKFVNQKYKAVFDGMYDE